MSWNEEYMNGKKRKEKSMSRRKRREKHMNVKSINQYDPTAQMGPGLCLLLVSGFSPLVINSRHPFCSRRTLVSSPLEGYIHEVC